MKIEIVSGAPFIAVGLVASLYCFWSLQFGSQHRRNWGILLIVLIACFFLLAYGTYLLLQGAPLLFSTRGKVTNSAQGEAADE